jgi:Mlc titration factor MtfA (ptsG expression regulator)
LCDKIISKKINKTKKMQIQLASVLAGFLLLLALAMGGYDVYSGMPTGYEPIPVAYVGLCVIAAATIFTLSNQINWWWFERNPPRLDEMGERVLRATLPYYANLSVSERSRFGSRVYMFLMDKDFVGAGTPDEEVPEEIKVMIAACVVQFTFGLEEYWLPDLEKIIVYPKFFPTVERPVFHAGEAHEDHCLILSGKMTREGMINAAEYYHIGLHVAAEYWQMTKRLTATDLCIMTTEAEFVETLEHIRLFKKDFWRGLTGIHTQDSAFDIATRITEIAAEGVDVPKMAIIPTPIFELAAECFFTKPNEMAAILPDTFNALMQILKQDPRKDTYPALK